MSYEAIRNVHSELLTFMKEQMEYNVYIKNRVIENERKLDAIKTQFENIYSQFSSDYSMVVEQIDHLNSQNDIQAPTVWKNYFAYNPGDRVIYTNGRVYEAVAFSEAGKEPTVHNGIWNQIYPDHSPEAAYAKGDRVYHTDNLVYEASQDVEAGSGLAPVANPAIWVQIN